MGFVPDCPSVRRFPDNYLRAFLTAEPKPFTSFCGRALALGKNGASLFNCPIMTRPGLTKATANDGTLVSVSNDTEGVANVTVIYQDASTRKWARQFCAQIESLVGVRACRMTWWKVGDLSEPGVLAGAVSTALRADVFIVALQADQPLPVEFCMWTEAWLPHRNAPGGSLLALIALPEQPGSHSDEAQDYLRAIARQSRLDFLIEERKLGSSALAESLSESETFSPVL